MKRLSTTLLVALFAITAFAQDLPQGFGFQVGFTQPILRLNSPNTRYAQDSLVNTTTLNGLKVGLVYDATFIKGFGSSIGLNYTFAQGQTEWLKTGLYDYPRSRTRTTYQQMELFVDWQYKFEIAGGTYIILYTGPSIQCGLSLKERVFEESDLGTSAVQTKEYSLFDYNDSELSRDLNRFNVTWGVGVGFQYQQFFLRGGYDFGLINPYKETNFNKMGFSNDRYTRGRLDQWSIKLGMYLWRK